MRKAEVFHETKEHEHLLEAEACLVVMSEKVKGRTNNDVKLGVDKQRFLVDWIRNRNNVMAINGSLLIASGLAFLIAVFLPVLCLKWKMQFDLRWFIFATIVNIFAVAILSFSWYTLSEEVVRVEAGIYKMLAGLPGSNLVLKNNSSETKDESEE